MYHSCSRRKFYKISVRKSACGLRSNSAVSHSSAQERLLVNNKSFFRANRPKMSLCFSSTPECLPPPQLSFHHFFCQPNYSLCFEVQFPSSVISSADIFLPTSALVNSWILCNLQHCFSPPFRFMCRCLSLQGSPS